MITIRQNAERGASNERDDGAPAPLPAEHLRDQVFASCGYALALAAAATWLLGPFLGARGLPTVLTLSALLFPLNLLAIRRLARARRSLNPGRPGQPNRTRSRY